VKKPLWYLELGIKRSRTESERFTEIQQTKPEYVNEAKQLCQMSPEDLDKKLKEILGE